MAKHRSMTIFLVANCVHGTHALYMTESTNFILLSNNFKLCLVMSLLCIWVLGSKPFSKACGYILKCKVYLKKYRP